MSESIALAVDGGNSKTDLALVDSDGRLLSAVRGPGSSPQRLGVAGCVEVLERLLCDAIERASLDTSGETVADVAEILMAGADLPQEEEALHAALEKRNWVRSVAVANATFAVLRTGTDRGWGVAIVCGAGLTCVGIGGASQRAPGSRPMVRSVPGRTTFALPKGIMKFGPGFGALLYVWR